MKHPFMVSWIDKEGQIKSSSFASESRRNTVAQYKLEQGYSVWIADQIQLAMPNEPGHSSTYDPRYEIPF